MTPSPLLEVIVVVTANIAVAWVATHLVHSTLAVVGAWAVTRAVRLSPSDNVRIWRLALFAPLVSATAHAFGAGVSSPLSVDLSRVMPSALAEWGVAAAIVTFVVLAASVVAGVSWPSSRALRRALGLRRPPDGGRDLEDEVASLARASRWPAPRVTVSDTSVAPAAVGSSEICVPVTVFGLLPVAEQRALLAHELGHLVRRDPLWQAAAATVVRLTVFQPLNRLALQKLRVASEQAADDFAVRLTGDAVALARALTSLTAVIVAVSGAASAAGSPVVERVERLFGPFDPPRRIHRALSRAAICALIGFAVIAPAVTASPERVANRISWLTPSREEPNPRMLELRRVLQDWRQSLHRWVP